MDVIGESCIISLLDFGFFKCVNMFFSTQIKNALRIGGEKKKSPGAVTIADPKQTAIHSCHSAKIKPVMYISKR